MASIYETHPTDTSLRVLHHFAQGTVTEKFLYYDFGTLQNKLTYGAMKPPAYPLQVIRTTPLIRIYGALNDDLVSVTALRQLAAVVRNVKLEFVPIRDFNHMDFCFAKNLATILINCILGRVDEAEGKPNNDRFCNFEP